MMQGFNNRYNGLVIKKLLLIVSRDNYQSVYNRSYTLNTNAVNLSKLESCTHHIDSSVRRVSPNELAHTVPTIVSLNPTVAGEARIPYGWNTQRLRFILEVEYPALNGIMVQSFIQGFTEYHDPSITGKIDPNMMFYINSINNVDAWQDPIRGSVKKDTVISNNIIREIPMTQESPVGDEQKVMITPYDIHNKKYLDSQYGVSEQMNGVITKSQIYNTSDKVTSSQPRLSSKANNNPFKYVTQTINSYVEATMNAEMSFMEGDILQESSNRLKGGYLVDHPFFVALNNINGDFNPTSFTLGELLAIDPSLETNNRITLIERSDFGFQDNFATMLNTEVTNETLQPTFENIKANIMASMLPSLMLDSLLTNVSVSITNASGQPVVIVSQANSFITDGYIPGLVEKLVILLETQLVPVLSDGGLHRFEVIASCDIIGDLTIAIGYNGNPHTVYRFPVFADSLFTPVVTNMTQSEIVHADFDNMLDIVTPHSSINPVDMEYQYAGY